MICCPGNRIVQDLVEAGFFALNLCSGPESSCWGSTLCEDAFYHSLWLNALCLSPLTLFRPSGGWEDVHGQVEGAQHQQGLLPILQGVPKMDRTEKHPLFPGRIP